MEKSYNAVLRDGTDIDEARKVFERLGGSVSQTLRMVRVITFTAVEPIVDQIRQLTSVQKVEENRQVRAG